MTNNTIDINVVLFDRVYDYNACMSFSWRRACARPGWGPAASGGQCGLSRKFPRGISRDSHVLAP